MIVRVLSVLGSLALFCVPAAAAAIAAHRISRSSRDEWKVAAWLPVVPLAVWGPYITIATTRDPTSHNLWPFELVAWSMLTLLLFGVVLIARRLLGRTDQTTFPGRR